VGVTTSNNGRTVGGVFYKICVVLKETTGPILVRTYCLSVIYGNQNSNMIFSKTARIIG
jgi:hypothetical protein